MQKPMPPTRYFPYRMLKHDLKGRVLLCFDLLLFRRVVLKEGVPGQCADGAGRDIRDRIRWQASVYAALRGRVRLPAVYGVHQKKGRTWLALGYVRGETLHDAVQRVLGGQPVFTAGPAGLQYLKTLLGSIINNLENMHAAGYVFRDLTTRNLLVPQKDAVVFTDFELAYSVAAGLPQPPFGLGSAGFMPPEQASGAPPAFAEDVYALGAVMVAVFTGLSPTRFDTADPNTLKEKLFYFMRCPALVQLVSDCLAADPAARPGLASVKRRLETSGTGSLNEWPVRIDKAGMTALIEDSLRGLSSRKLTDRNGVWWSKVRPAGHQAANAGFDYSARMGLGEGIAGVIFLLATAKTAGYDTTRCSNLIQTNIAFLERHFLGQAAALPPGLLHGSWGVGVGLAAAMRAGWVEDTDKWRGYISDCLAVPGGGPAGKYMAQTLCGGFNWAVAAGDTITSLISESQTLRHTGLFTGMAGYALALLDAGRRDPAAMAAAVRLLDRLSKTDSQKAGPWLGEGFSGWALVLARAYHLLGVVRYKMAAERLLRLVPPHVADNSLTLEGGLAGLGLAYLEADKALGGNEWRDRADWLAGLLAHTFFRQADGSVYWNTDHTVQPTADLLAGNAGIIYFLIQYQL